MPAAPLPADEAQRLAELRSLAVLDTPAETDFDDLTRLAAQICQTPIAIISLVDATRQWFKSRVGLELTETPREVAYCAHAILTPDQATLVPDSLNDPRFADNPFASNLRFYAGTPLTTASGRAMGTLCVADHLPRTLTPSQLEALQTLGRQVVMHLVQRQRIAELRQLMENRREAEDLRRESEQRFRTLATLAPVGIYQTDADGNCLYVNEHWSQLTGLSPSEAAGTGWARALHPDDRERIFAAWRLFTANGGTFALDYRYLRPDGSTLWVAGRAVALSDSGRTTGYLGTVMDITEHRQVEHTLRTAKEAAEGANRAKSDFLAVMSHEIRTPMNGVIGLSGLLLGTPLDPTQREHVEGIRTSGEHLLTVINDVLDYSKIDAGRLELAQVPCDLHELAYEAAALLAGKAQAKGLELYTDLDPALPTEVLGDPGRLRQILINLVGNAVKFTTTGEVCIGGSLSGDGNLQLWVRDSGIGIPADVLPRLFSAFTQADTSITRRFGGTGLGLVISKRLAAMMGGGVTVTSTPGVGSTFTLEIPLHRAPAPGPGQSRHQPLSGHHVLAAVPHHGARVALERRLRALGAEVTTAATGDEVTAALARGAVTVLIDHGLPGGGATLAAAISRAGMRAVLMAPANVGEEQTRTLGFSARVGKPLRQGPLLAALDPARAPAATTTTTPKLRGRVLVAEDNSINQRVIAAQLIRMGLKADVVGNGAEALAALDRAPYDLVLMDCQMPEMDGLTATAALRQQEQADPSRRRIPVVALTANHLSDDRNQALAAGMDGYLTKPVRMEELVATLATWLPAADGAVRQEVVIPPR